MGPDLEREFESMIVAMYGGPRCISDNQYAEQRKAFMGGAVAALAAIPLSCREAEPLREQLAAYQKTLNAEARAANFERQ